ncbi:MAG: alpha-L-fucosidase [Lentisphaeria bacterium]|nr:alpha-L-fucosidase [Lentisphaeria bacterium]
MRFTDQRKWFHEKRFGMFVHWGIYALGGRHEQEQMRYSVPAAEYEKYVQRFNPEKFDPVAWLDMIQENGMEYLVFTAKHHDGFCMWDTAETDYNIMNTPYKKDIVGMLAEECHKRDFPLEIYYSCVDWHHPAYPNLGRHHEIKTDPAHHNMDEYMDYLKRQIRELCTNYGKIHGIWWDMNVPELVDPSVNELIRQLQPAAVINNRGYGPGDYSTPERDYQAEGFEPYQNPVEACDSVGANSWGYCAENDYFSIRKLERQIALYTALGGNFLLNAGPKADGTFADGATRILREVGKWYKKLKPALTATPCGGIVPNTTAVCTGKDKTLNLVILDGPFAEAFTIRGFGYLPERVISLNTGEEFPCTLEPIAATIGMPPSLRIRKMPCDRMKDEIHVLQMQFAEPFHPQPQNLEMTEEKEQNSSDFSQFV